MTEFEQRLQDLETALKAVAAPGRIVTRHYRERDMIPDVELFAGVFTLISRGVYDFTNRPGRMAEFGRHKVLITGQLRVAEDADGATLEVAEFALVAELQALARSALPESIGGLEMLSFDQSGQLERPYGWIAVVFEIGP